MKTYKEYKESLIEENNPSEFKDNISFKSKKQNEDTPILSIDIQIDENNSKKFEINSFDELDNKLNSFCEENKLPESAKKYIYNSIMEKINQNQNQAKCKNLLYI